MAHPVPPEMPQILRDLNSWWAPSRIVRPIPPRYRRRNVADLEKALSVPKPLIHVLRGPRQVGKTTALYQVVRDRLRAGAAPTDLFLIRFDLQPIQEAGLLPLVRWYEKEIRQRPFDEGEPTLLLLDEVHKLDRWAEQVKHLFDTFRVSLVLTGSSSVLVARGQRESLAGRAITIDFPPFSFREVLECWHGDLASALPQPARLESLLRDMALARSRFEQLNRHPARRRLSWRRLLERYYNRGGYPRLHEPDESIEDRWSDYLVETVFDRVLGVDIPDLFPVEQPQLLRHIYLEAARRTGTEISQGALTQDCNAAGFRTAQPVVGRYLHYLADAMLIREFRRYPLATRRTARVPIKITLTDLGVRNALFRGAPSLWESAPEVLGPLVETLVQSVLRGPGLQVHFYRDYEEPGNRRSPLEEVDFVVEALDGTVLPVEVKFRKNVTSRDLVTLRRFMNRFGSPWALLVTRELCSLPADDRILCVPVLDFSWLFEQPHRNLPRVVSSRRGGPPAAR